MNAKKETKWEPCPFCGSTDVAAFRIQPTAMWAVCCTNCDAAGPRDARRQDAEANWNRRPI